LCRYRHPSIATQLNSTSSWAELCRYKHPLTTPNVCFINDKF